MKNAKFIHSYKNSLSKLIFSFVFVLTIGLISTSEAFSQVINVPAGDTAALIDAINQANVAPDAATINLGGGTYTLTEINNTIIISGSPNGLPLILTNMTFNGNGSIIERSTAPGTPLFRIFYIGDQDNDIFHPDVTFNDLTIRNGHSTNTGGGGLLNFGDGIINIDDCVVSDNTDANNQAAGIINDQQGTMNINRTTITRNIKSGNGGGAGGVINDFDGVLNITDSTVSHNIGGRAGGVGNNSGGLINILNTTISGNTGLSSLNASAGGVNNNSGGTINIDSSTITNNDGTDAGNIGLNSGGSVFLINSIVGETATAPSCFDRPGSSGLIVSEGYNIDQGTSCGFNSIGDKSNTNPQLAPLASNGGPTETHALIAGSPALDMGKIACPPPATDQRGEPRPLGIRCDIGAFEGIVSPVPTLSEWGLIAMAGILGIVGFMVIRRRQATA